MPKQALDDTLTRHGATRLPGVDIESYNVELKIAPATPPPLRPSAQSRLDLNLR
jgi:hypothetical protein